MNLKYMEMAIEEAYKAMSVNEVPVGCIIVKDGKVISTGYNKKESLNAVTRHAELIAIEKASSVLNNWRLNDCDIYITLEPCPMCASAIKQARIKNVYCGLSNSDVNNLNIINQIFQKDKNNKSVNFCNDLAVEKVNLLMKSFFEKQRKK